MAEAHKEKCQARMLEICEREFPEELDRKSVGRERVC